jgi:hypothetical protein
MPLPDALLALAAGLALAGLLSSGRELLTGERTDFALLERGDLAALAAVPLITLGGPFIILRNVVERPRHLAPNVARAFGAAVLAGGWSVMSGVVLIDLVARLSG